MASPEDINQASGRTLNHAVVSLPASTNVSPAEPERTKTTTGGGQLSFVGIAKGEGEAGGEVGGPGLSVRATRKEPTNPVMAR